MGIDVNAYVLGDVSDAELAAANDYMLARGVHGWGREDPPLARDPHDWGDGPRIKWRTLYRYYGPGYERGHWPDIHNALVLMRTALPRATVHYGGDTTDLAEPVTDDRLAELWAHWLGPQGQGYREYMRAVTGQPSR